MNNTMFQVTFPDEWKETTVFTFEGPHDSGVQHNLVLVVDPFVSKDMELHEYAQQQLAGPKTVMPGFELINEQEKRMSDGTIAYEIVYKYIPAENVILYQKQIYQFRDKKALVFTATFSKKTLATLGPVFDNVIASFRMLKPVEDDY
jgi:hypothetical protein